MLSDKIKELRCQKGLSQEELANKLNVVRQTVSKWEKGLSLPDSDMLIGLARELDTSVSALLEEKVAATENVAAKSKSHRIITIILLILGSPIWLSLIIAALAVVISVYAVMWSVIISLWAIEGAFIGCTLGAMVASIGFICMGDGLKGVVLIGAGLICAGLSILMFFGCNATTKGVLMLTKNIAVWIKSFFAKGVTDNE